jgi:hypothetical protein
MDFEWQRNAGFLEVWFFLHTAPVTLFTTRCKIIFSPQNQSASRCQVFFGGR